MPHSPRFLSLVDAAKAQIREITVADLITAQDSAARLVVVDVREAHEYAAGHIPGAVHLSKGVLERDIEDRFPNVHTALALYCGGGYRSALAALQLQNMGYTAVSSVAGGWRAWQAR